MRISIAVLLITGITLSGCSSWQGSKANPSNWFSKSKSTDASGVASAEQLNPLIPENTDTGLFSKSSDLAEDFSLPVASITELRIEKTPTGAILYTSGLASRQGAYDVRLRRNEDTESSTLEYSFRAVYPETATPVGSENTRTLRVAVSLTHQELAGVKLIRVSSDSNARETRR
jgi:hypothetical protein